MLGDYDWRLSAKNVWKVEQMLLDWPHRRIASSDAQADAMRRRYRAFREAHGYKPWKYYRGASGGRRCRRSSTRIAAELESVGSDRLSRDRSRASAW